MDNSEEARRSLGFPEGTQFRSLASSLTGECLVVGASIKGEQRPCTRLYVRRFDATTYREVALPPVANSWASPVLSPSRPELFALAEQWTDDGGDFVGLYRAELPEGDPVLVHPARGGVVAGGVRSPWWLSRLLAVSQDGDRLLVVRAAGAPHGTGTRYHYAVGLFDPGGGAFHALTRLPATFA